MGELGEARPRGALPIALRVLLVVGFVIAVAATALVAFADDVKMLRLAAVLALWAALIGAFAVTRSRRDARAAVMREGEAQLAYQLELHREVAARREYEADLSQQVAAAQSDQLAELRGQLEHLTSVLSSLVDGEVTVSRLTLSAESAKFRRGVGGPQAAALRAEQRPAVTAGSGSGPHGAADLADLAIVDAGHEPSGPAAPVVRARADAPAAAWARRHAESVRARDVQRDRRGGGPGGRGGEAGGRGSGAKSPGAAPESRVNQAESPVAQPKSVAAGTEEANAERDRAGAEKDGVRMDGTDMDGANGDGAGGDGAGDHESGVSVADLLAAYGLSGRSRRRREG